jgi:hypothetical protein|tara:strand:+ start:302 stop:484 length:183 start_codon:yes stop_codon:yes gene_type:complete
MQRGNSMLKSFVITDNAGNTYRNVARSMSASIQKVTQEHNISENDIANVSQKAGPKTFGL